MRWTGIKGDSQLLNLSEASPNFSESKMSKQLSIAVFALFAVLCGIQASSDDVKTKFLEAKISPDVLETVPDLKFLKISYPSGVSVDLGNLLTPTQVKDQPKVEWEAEEGAFYTLLMTGELN